MALCSVAGSRGWISEIAWGMDDLLIHKHRVILIGGTSHTGKSTLAQSLAHKLGWSWLSTDSLARHPGRPWRIKPEVVPEHVAEHYLSLSVDELLADVLRHYRENVWPIASALVIAHATDPSIDGLVLEGSALWPDWVAALDLDNIAAIWLTASNLFIAQRIHLESHYHQKTRHERLMIDQFLNRTLVFNEQMMVAVRQLGLLYLDVTAAPSLEQLSGESLALLTSTDKCK